MGCDREEEGTDDDKTDLAKDTAGARGVFSVDRTEATGTTELAGAGAKDDGGNIRKIPLLTGRDSLAPPKG